MKAAEIAGLMLEVFDTWHAGSPAVVSGTRKPQHPARKRFAELALERARLAVKTEAAAAELGAARAASAAAESSSKALAVSKLRELRDELEAAYAGELARAAGKRETPDLHVGLLKTGFRDGLSYMLGGLRTAGAVELVDDVGAGERVLEPGKA